MPLFLARMASWTSRKTALRAAMGTSPSHSQSDATASWVLLAQGFFHDEQANVPQSLSIFIGPCGFTFRQESDRELMPQPQRVAGKLFAGQRNGETCPGRFRETINWIGWEPIQLQPARIIKSLCQSKRALKEKRSRAHTASSRKFFQKPVYRLLCNVRKEPRSVTRLGEMHTVVGKLEEEARRHSQKIPQTGLVRRYLGGRLQPGTDRERFAAKPNIEWRTATSSACTVQVAHWTLRLAAGVPTFCPGSRGPRSNPQCLGSHHIDFRL